MMLNAGRRRRVGGPVEVTGGAPMTEAEWLAATDGKPLLEWIRSNASDRKARLTACALCRRQWDRTEDERIRKAVASAEAFADGLLSAKALTRIRRAAYAVPWRGVIMPAARARADAWNAAREAIWDGLRLILNEGAGSPVPDRVRCIFGNPFRPATVNPAWLTPAVTSLAAAAYEERSLPSGELDPPRLAVLADALEDGGCADPDLLGHLRSAGPHVRGCWALDLVLGKG
jgi:hypothetical protein